MIEADGDLGLGRTITTPECDGSYVVFVLSSYEPARYQSEIGAALRAFPGSNYMRTDVVGCASLRHSLEGNFIYAVYLGPFSSEREAHAACRSAPSGSYIKPLDHNWDAMETIVCR